MGRVAIVVIVACVTALATGAGACTSTQALAPGGDDPLPNRDDAGRPNPCSKSLDDDHANCGACGAACGEMEHCLRGRCAPGCADHAVYVSVAGSDDASGCVSTSPKRTVGSALALVKELAAEGHAVRVCRGQYDESVRLDYPVALLGGYDCATWTRSAGYGAPAFDGLNETVVRGTAVSPPLVVAALDGAVIDGLTLRARDNAAGPSMGVLVDDGAKARLSNVKALGAAGAPDRSPGSMGLKVDGGAFADVSASILDGGTGPAVPTSGYGSAGIFVTASGGGLHLAGSRVSGGSGRVGGGTGSIGILALGASLASTIDSSVVHGGLGRASTGSATYGIGFFGSRLVDVTVSDSVIDGGSGGCAGSCSVTGVSINAKGKVRVSGNHIHGGEAKPDLADKIAFYGVRLTDFEDASVQNNSIFSGNSQGHPSGAAAALSLTRGGSALIANNTLALGPSPGTPGSLVVATSKTATLANNLLLNAATTAPGPAVALDACAGQIYPVQNNAWVGFQEGAELFAVKRLAGASCAYSADATIDALEATVRLAFGTANVGGNRRISDACTADSQCTALPGPCASGPSCIPVVLDAWEPSSAGALLSTGWKLSATTPCTITKGGLPLPGLLARDAFGNARTTPLSMGAHEHDGACQ